VFNQVGCGSANLVYIVFRLSVQTFFWAGGEGECFPLSYVACCVKFLHFGFDFTLGCIGCAVQCYFQLVHTSSIYDDYSLVVSLPLQVRGEECYKAYLCKGW